MNRLHADERVQRRTRPGEDHVFDAELDVFEEYEIAGLDRRRYMRDSQVIAGHVMDANGSSEHAEIVPRGRPRERTVRTDGSHQINH